MDKGLLPDFSKAQAPAQTAASKAHDIEANRGPQIPGCDTR